MTGEDAQRRRGKRALAVIVAALGMQSSYAVGVALLYVANPDQVTSRWFIVTALFVAFGAAPVIGFNTFWGWFTILARARALVHWLFVLLRAAVCWAVDTVRLVVWHTVRFSERTAKQVPHKLVVAVAATLLVVVLAVVLVGTVTATLLGLAHPKSTSSTPTPTQVPTATIAIRPSPTATTRVPTPTPTTSVPSFQGDFAVALDFSPNPASPGQQLSATATTMQLGGGPAAGVVCQLQGEDGAGPEPPFPIGAQAFRLTGADGTARWMLAIPHMPPGDYKLTLLCRSTDHAEDVQRVITITG